VRVYAVPGGALRCCGGLQPGESHLRPAGGLGPPALGYAEPVPLLGLGAVCRNPSCRSFYLFSRVRRDVAYLLEARTGFPFGVVNQEGFLVGQPDGSRYPSYFNVNLHFERRLSAFFFIICGPGASGSII